MKTKLFGKTAALVMGSLMIFSGQALAFSSNNPELSNGNALSNSEILIAQDELEFDVISQLAADAQTVLGNLTADLDSIAESDLPGKNTLSQVAVRLQSVVGDIELASNNQSLTRGDGVALATTAADLSATVGNISATLATTAQTEEGRAVAQTGVMAATTVGDIALDIRSEASATGSENNG